MKRLQQHFGHLSVAWNADALALSAISGFGVQTIETVLMERARRDPAQCLEQHLEANPDFWTPFDRDYPRLLLEIPDPPPLLYYRGVVVREENQGVIPTVAMVGTRDPSDYGKRWTRRISIALAQRGFTIVSGMAEGIDTEAHSGCLEVGGRTLAVLGTGVDVIYPPRNQRLYEQILGQGLVLSEYPAGTPPERGHFPRRNRVIAALSRAVIVLEAPSKSGALITAHLANDYNRDVYVLPGSLDNPRSQGCLGLLSRGAQVILGEGYLLEQLGSMPQLDPDPTPTVITATLIPDLEPELQQVLTAIAPESTLFDQIVQQTSLPTSVVSSALVQLELLGLIIPLPGMAYQRS
ncbi:DNA-processing protein DprA [Neosynechococcus sphagnicola]|uniref:DNA-processing protein DprA n=1 Tax=Neosynechococcus sphagnicola TaxID=1501145 RepID=UPI001EF9F934|nr:DNA-processing protein DprA [Neosynechococcus sphagnicola]